jgi:hypothetical protein
VQETAPAGGFADKVHFCPWQTYCEVVLTAFLKAQETMLLVGGH